MNDDLFENLSPKPGENIDPIELARRDLKSSLPKRFYKSVSVAAGESGFQILLDGRPVRTPQRSLLAAPDETLALAIAGEWSAQVEYIDPAHMPLTRIVNSALDGVAREMDATAAEIVKYAGSDLLCYRADDPEALVAEQVEALGSRAGLDRQSARCAFSSGKWHRLCAPADGCDHEFSSYAREFRRCRGGVVRGPCVWPVCM